MRIAVTAKGAGLGAWLDPDFGKCQQIVVVDEEGDFQAFPNPARDLPGGQGMALAKHLAGLGLDAVVTGVLNPQAYRWLLEAGISVFLMEGEGSVLEAVEKVKTGQLAPAGLEQVEVVFAQRGLECR
ncbi:MAG: NifB/NifX family molybdenum-iron cluster-binding protein [Anaerolineae bacterium]